MYLSDLLGVHDFKTLRRLRECGYPTALCTFIADIDRPNFQRSGYDVCTIPGLKIFHDASLAKENIVNLVRRAFVLRKAFHAFDPDVFYAGWIQTSGLLCFMSGARPYVIQTYGSDVLLAPFQNTRAWIKTLLAVSRASAIVCNSESQRRILAGRFKSRRVYVIPRGVDLRFFRPPESRAQAKKELGFGDRPLIVCTKTFRTVYRISDIVRAMPFVQKKYPGAVLVLIGDGPQKELLVGLAEQLGVKEMVRMPGYLSPEEIRAHLWAADVFVTASASEAGPISLMEAMACATPVVASDIEGHREWIRDGEEGLLFPMGYEEKLADGVVRILAEPTLASRLGEKARAFVCEHGDFDKNFDRILDLLNRAASTQNEKV